MGKKLIDPSIDIEPIEYPIDINAAVDVEPDLNFYGNYVPLLKFGDETVIWVKIIDFKLSIRLHQLPSVQITLDDSDFAIREFLKNDIQIGIVRLGYKNYALKFNTLFTNISSIISDNEIILNGIIYNENMFEDYPQSSYKDKTISEILKELCESVGQGLFIYDNDDLSRKYTHLIQSNMNYIEYVSYLLNNYTTNLWTFDANYFLHVGDFNSISNGDLATYSLSPTSGIPLEKPVKMEFYRNAAGADPNEELNNAKLSVSGYTVNSSYSEEFIHLKEFYEFFDNNQEIDLEQNEFGIGSKSSNTFSGFIDIRRPFQQAIKSKLISRQVISVYIDYILPELNPFDLINLEFYIGPRPGVEPESESDGDLDVEHSGDKVVIGYDITYTKRNSGNVSENGYTGMTIYCI
jgi:hypothetical protein